MYAWLWSRLPAPLWIRLVIAVAVVGGVLAACMAWVFPDVLALVQDLGSGTAPNEVVTPG